MSVRLKISVLSAVISGAILAGFGLAAWYRICHERLAALDREIRTLAARHPGWLAHRSGYDRLTSMLAFTFGQRRQDDVILLLRDCDGKELYRSPHWPARLDVTNLSLAPGDDPALPTAETVSQNQPRVQPPGPSGRAGLRLSPDRVGRTDGERPEGPPLFTKAPRFFTAKAGAALWRLGAFGNGQTSVILGINYDEIQGELNRLRDAFLLVLPAALVLVGIGGWITGSQALRPLRLIADTAEGVTARGLDQRIPLADSDQEVARLITVLNKMMDRLEKSFHQATRFTADASHELKTPLAIMQGALDHALQTVPIGSPQQVVFNHLLEETHRLKNITRTLLLLAQADSGQLKLCREPIDLTDLLENMLEDARVLAAPSDLAFDVHIPPGLQTIGDAHLLSTAIRNVIGNAVKHNEPHGRIALHVRTVDGPIAIVVANTGPGISQADQRRLFERFFRGGPTGRHSAEGSGLGLSLAREILCAHGGELALQESRPGWPAFVIRLA
ncbi:MAG: HAMP domain-containing sensor histidine kinase [Verrucomicrobiota bacterium]